MFKSFLKLFGLEVRKSAQPNDAQPPRTVWRRVFDWTGGAWQADGTYEGSDTPNARLNSVAYACMRALATDIAKLPPEARRQDANGTWPVVEAHNWSKLLRRPNPYQTWIEFMISWKLTLYQKGAAYIIKLKDPQGVVRELRVLDACKVQPLVSAETGAVYYELFPDGLCGISTSTGRVVVAASEMIHDKYMTLENPLVGVPPLVVACLGANTASRILRDFNRLYGNGGVPPGVLTIPDGYAQAEIDELSTSWETFRKQAKTAIIEDGITYSPIDAKSVDGEALKLLEFTAKDVCAAFGVPEWRVFGTSPVTVGGEARQIDYWQSTLQWQLEQTEALLDEGLQLPTNLWVKFDVLALTKMDTAARITSLTVGIKGSLYLINEARAMENLPPVAGGDVMWMQQQNYSLPALIKRDEKGPPPTAGQPGPGAPNADKPDDAEEEDPKDKEVTALLGEQYRGVWKAEASYDQSDIVTHRGLWLAQHASCGGRPGTGAAWKLILKERS